MDLRVGNMGSEGRKGGGKFIALFIHGSIDLHDDTPNTRTTPHTQHTYVCVLIVTGAFVDHSH